MVYLPPLQIHFSQNPTRTPPYLTAQGDDLVANDRRGAAAILLDPEEGTRTWKALLLVTVVRSKARTAVAVESTRMI